MVGTGELIRRDRMEVVAVTVDYRRKVTIPIRDMWSDMEVVFCVDVYGVTPRDLAQIPGGSAPMMRAVERLGLDPMRYQSTLWDIPL